MQELYEVRQLQQLDQQKFTQLQFLISQGAMLGLSYHYSIASKKGRTLGVIKNHRILILLLWNNKPHSIGYIQYVHNFPPWQKLPTLKYQKQISVIKQVILENDQNTLTFQFLDKDDPWKFVFASKRLAKDWHQLIYNHNRYQSNIQYCQRIRTSSVIISQVQQQTQIEEMSFQQDQSYQLSRKSSQKLSERASEILQLPTNEQKPFLESLLAQKTRWLQKQQELKLTIKQQIISKEAIQVKYQQLMTKYKHLQKQNKNLEETVEQLYIENQVNKCFKDEYSKKVDRLRIQLLEEKEQRIKVEVKYQAFLEEKARQGQTNLQRDLIEDKQS